MACDPITYSNVDGIKWAAIKTAVEEQMPELSPMADAGSGSHYGVTLAWVWANNTLTITCTSKPFFVGCETIKEKLDAAINPLLGG